METLTETKTQAQPETTSAPSTPQQPAAADTPAAAVEEKLKTQNKAKNGANWFFWIAALSMINSIMTLAGTEWGFIIGLGITQVFDVIGAEFGASPITFVLSTLAAGTFVFFGVLANKRLGWAYVVGMVCYGLDGLLYLAFGDILSAGFHAFVLFWIFQGYRANKELAAA